MNTNKSSKLPLLAGALTVQVLLAALLFWSNSRNPATIPEPLILARAENINKVVIKGEDSEVILQKQGDAWLDSAGLPADSPRVASLVEQLTALKSGFPVASTAAAQERFEVGDKNYQRKITVVAGGDTAEPVSATTLYFGKSVNVKQVHARAENTHNIYAATFSVFDAPTSENAWLDTHLLQPKAEVTAIKLGDFQVTKTHGQWPGSDPAGSVEGHAIDSATDHAEASTEVTAATAEVDSETQLHNSSAIAHGVFSPEALVQALKLVQVMGVATEQLDDAVQAAKIQIVTSADTLDYQLLTNKDEYYIRRSDYNVTFMLGKSHYDTLLALAKQAQLG